MKVHFVKMSGAGNDMILVDHRRRFLAGSEERFARAVCDRRRGIGADGVILLEEDDRAAFAVRFFNPDGSEYGLCGNGARCVPVFAAELGLAGSRCVFRSPSGLHEGVLVADGVARVGLPPVRRLRLDVPADLEGRPVRLDWGDIGVPHASLGVDDVPAVPIAAWGAHLRSHPAFGPDGTNVSFVRLVGPDRLEIRTFERGVEGETLACGSGSAVAATVARAKGHVGRRVELAVASGDVLVVHLPADEGSGPDLEGPITRSFEGEVDLQVLLPGHPPAR